VALISGHPEKLSKFGEQYGVGASSRYSYETMDEIRHNPEIDVVYVVTPPATHAGFVERAAKAGKHVTSEKPMAPTVAECERMIRACRKVGRLLQVGYRCHYEAHNLRAIEAMRKKELGKIHSIRSDHGFNIGGGTWRTQKALAGGGSMMDIGIYSLNALRYLLGEEPTSVQATITTPPNDPRFVDIEDTVEFNLDFPSFKWAIGSGGYSWQQGKSQYEVVGENGTLRADPATPYAGHRLMLNGQDLPVTPNNQFLAQVEHMSSCIRDHKPVLTPGEEGLRDIRIIQAIYEAGRTGKRVRIG
jgi:glucose-fructose oxidoreductase